MEKRLGRGLGSLLGEPQGSDDLLELELDRIRPNPFQPRTSIDPAALEELADSIRSHGVLQPLAVRSLGSGFELIAGERRWRAARIAGLSRVPAVVRREVSDQQMLEWALVENLQRRDLDPIERARGFKSLQEGLGLTQEQVAEAVGLQRSTVTNHLRLLDLAPAVQDAVAKDLISMGHARALLGVKEPSDQVRLMEQAARESWSVREVERRVQARSGTKRQVTLQPTAAPAAPQPPWAAELERRMRESLGTKVSLQALGETKGRIVIDYYSREALDRLCLILAPRPSV
jgi:ParB family chromosome partitioning protein